VIPVKICGNEVVSITPSQNPMVKRDALPLNPDNLENFEIVDVDY
jgi:hypothetical protein